jgi:hypothetical protein
MEFKAINSLYQSMIEHKRRQLKSIGTPYDGTKAELIDKMLGNVVNMQEMLFHEFPTKSEWECRATLDQSKSEYTFNFNEQVGTFNPVYSKIEKPLLMLEGRRPDHNYFTEIHSGFTTHAYHSDNIRQSLKEDLLTIENTVSPLAGNVQGEIEINALLLNKPGAHPKKKHPADGYSLTDVDGPTPDREAVIMQIGNEPDGTFIIGRNKLASQLNKQGFSTEDIDTLTDMIDAHRKSISDPHKPWATALTLEKLKDVPLDDLPNSILTPALTSFLAKAPTKESAGYRFEFVRTVANMAVKELPEPDKQQAMTDNTYGINEII